MADPREILGSIAIIYRSHLACMAKELEAYRIGSGQFDFLWFCTARTASLRKLLQKLLKSVKQQVQERSRTWKKRVMCTDKEMKMTLELTGFT